MLEIEYEQMKQELLRLKEYGYEIYASENRYYNWFFVVTPNKNILYIQKGDLFGFNVSLEYIPSNEYGSGCACNDNDEDVKYMDLQTIQELEKEGLELAHELGAQLYKNIEQAKKHIYKFEEFKKL
ncbi:hypothetical protein [[Eubacterium] hominis]|uniref:hypothetical protein n=1 Tax=[Eubacterium] hominis TaxID=2764325 RepID=UPI0022E60087